MLGYYFLSNPKARAFPALVRWKIIADQYKASLA